MCITKLIFVNKIKFWDVVGSRHKGKAEERIKKLYKILIRNFVGTDRE